MNLVSGYFDFSSGPSKKTDILVEINGFIDNQEELKTLLRQGVPNTNLDTQELLVQAYRLWGTTFPKFLRGDFAIALTDLKTGRLILSRDPLGAKTAYYCQTPRGFFYASRIEALIDVSGVRKKPDKKMIGQFFTGEFLEYDRTFFEGIKQIPPGHSLIVRNNGETELQRYWVLKPQTTSRSKTRQEYFDEFYNLFEDAVRIRLSPGTTTGLFLSGGLDSVQVCSVAENLIKNKKVDGKLKSICLLAQGFLAEDLEAIENLSKRYRPDIETIDFHALDSSKSLFEIYLQPREQPNYDAFLTTPLILERFHKAGCKTLLSGFGANEYSNPLEFGFLEQSLLNFQFQKFTAECKRFAACIHLPESQVRRMIYRETLREKTPYFVRRMIRANRLSKKAWVRSDFRKFMPVEPPVRLRPFGDLAQDECFQAFFELQTSMNLVQMDDAAERYQMTIRHPFLDLRLVEYWFSIPPDIKLQGGYRKNFIQQALSPAVPITVRSEDNERQHIPFPEPAQRRAFEASRALAYLKREKCYIYEYVDSEAIQLMARAENPDLNLAFLWRLVRLEQWLQQHWS